MPLRYDAIELRPPQGGALLSNLSDDTAGPVNYSAKLNFRRYLERECRREGHDYLWANPDVAIGNQPFPYQTPTNIAASGNWPGVADKLTVKKGWSYLYVAGIHEDHAVNGPGDGEGDLITATLVQAAADQIWIYPKGDAIGEARTYALYEYAPLTLIHEARRPNGQRALIVGTPTTLYRFAALENGDVFEDGVFDAGVFAGSTGEWIVIASGFSPDAQRWEAVCINGTSVFNNGRDPLFSYRVEELTAKAVYELRESCYAAVGCIAEFFGILMAGDISEIQFEKLLELFDPIGVRRSGAMLGEMPDPGGGSWEAKTTQDFFSASDAGRTIVFENGTAQDTIGFITARRMLMSGGTDTTPQRFMLRTKAAQTGSLFSGTISGTQASGSPNVLASAPVFSAPMVGKRLRYVNGWSSIIATYTNTTHVILTDNAPEAFAGLSFFIISEPVATSASGSPDFIVTAAAPIFTADMVGRNISWDDGTERRIVRFIDSTHVYVDFDMNIASQIIGIDNPATYAAYTEKQFINRIGYQLIWSMNDLPTRFGPVYKGSMDLNGFILKLDQPAKSIAIGDQLLVSGAGIAGGNLTATVLYVAAHRVIALDQRAATAVRGSPVEKADAVASIVGFEYLQDDSSAIIKMLELDGSLVIYKDTAIALARYTGDVAAPFAFQLRRVAASHCLYFRNTLIMVNEGRQVYGGSAQHIYAGRNSFYAFRTMDDVPVEIPELEACKNLFFSKASLENSKWIFAANNILSKEIFFGNFPYTGSDLVLCLEYMSQPWTVSTSDAMISAAASVKRPAAGATVGETSDFFLLGTPRGVVLLYGLINDPDVFSGAKQIFYRRDANPYSATKLSYPSRLRSGLSSFGSSSSEKDIRSFVPILSSKSPATALTFTLFGTRNPVESPATLMSVAVPADENLVALHYREVYFADQIAVESGIDNALELVARCYDISGVKSASFVRRKT
jgi:hypothetical protein